MLLLLAVQLAVPATAAADQWLQYDTDHFRVIYRAEDADAAAHVAELTPSVWERTTAFLQYEPSERIPVVLYGETARANGFFTPFPPHVALFTAAPAGPWMGARTADWLESVFVHEVTHYLHLMQPIGFFGTASRVFGPLAAAGGTLFLPGWALEGPTTTAETVLTAGGRGRNPYFEMEWVAPILADEMYSYDQAGVASAYPPRGRIYSSGYIMTEHLLREYGEEAFIEVNREFQRWPFLGMRRALRRTTGERAPEIHQAMVESLEARYAPRRNLPTGAEVGAEVGATDERSHPRTDPLAQRHLLGVTDRGAIAFHRGAFDAGSLQLLRENGGWRHLTAVTPLDEYSVTVSATGAVAAAVVQRTNRAGAGGGPNVSFGDLYLMELDEERGRRLTTGVRLFHPALDETGTTVIAAERTGRFSRLVHVDRETEAITPIYAPAERFVSMPALSRSGQYLAVVENDAGRQSIVVLSRTGTSPLRYAPVYRIDVGEEPDAEYRPLFAGDRELWFVADATGPLQLYRTTLPEGEAATPLPPITRILTDQVGVLAGVPDDGGKVLYGTYRHHGYTVRRGEPTLQMVGRVAPKPNLANAPAPAENGEDSGNAESSPGASPILRNSRRYWDLPRPVLWVPTAAVAGEVSGETRLDLGAGLIAVSTLGRHSLEAFAAYNPTDHQPSGSVAYTYAPGPTAFSMNAIADYSLEPDGTARDSYEIAAALTRPLWYDEGSTRYRGVTAQVGGAYELEEIDGFSQYAEFHGALRMARYRYSGAGQIFGGTGGEVQGAVQYQPQLLDRAEQDVATVTTAALRLGRRTGQLHVRPLAAVGTSTSGAAVDNLPWNASVFTPEGRDAIISADSAVMGRVALTGAARPLDLSWRGMSLQNAGSTAYVSQAAASQTGLSQAAGGSPAITADNYTVAGAELTLQVKFNLLPLNITAGVAVRLPHGEDAGARRTQFYVNLGGAAVDQVSVRWQDAPMVTSTAPAP